jgi:hypothetical protein
MTITYIYQKPGETCKICGGNKPLMLYITYKDIPGCHPEITINGSENPFPFKKFTVSKHATDLNKWLLEKGWVEIGHVYN